MLRHQLGECYEPQGGDTADHGPGEGSLHRLAEVEDESGDQPEATPGGEGPGDHVPQQRRALPQVAGLGLAEEEGGVAGETQSEHGGDPGERRHGTVHPEDAGEEPQPDDGGERAENPRPADQP